MRRNPAFYAPQSSREYIQEFRGYNHNLRCANNEFYDIVNMSSDDYPVLSTRGPRRINRYMSNPTGIISKNYGLWTIEDEQLCLNGVPCISGNPGFSLEFPGQYVRDMVSMGAYIIIFPDKVYANTMTIQPGNILPDCGYMEQVNNEFDITPAGAVVTYTITDREGSAYYITTAGPTAPEDPADGEKWIDTYGDVSVLKEWSDAQGMWLVIPTTYVRIEYPGIGKGFAQYDGITLAGCDCDSSYGHVRDEIQGLNGSHIAYQVEDDSVVVTGIISMGQVEQHVTQAAHISASRTVPAMDYVIEAENRLWGCRWGYESGGINEIYCSALGDFKNWEKYEGVSTDSWRGSVGSDGAFSGAINYQGHPLFFKPNCLHKIYISPEGAHQIVTTQLRGVAYNCSESLCIIDEVLYYKSDDDICAYDGSLPVSISGALGDMSDYRVMETTAGKVGKKLYMAIQVGISPAQYSIVYVYDTTNGIWHRESTIGVMRFVSTIQYDAIWSHTYVGEDPDSHMPIYSDRLIYHNDKYATAADEVVSWTMESGVQGYETPDHKYTSRYNLRMQMPRGSSCDLYIRYDDDTEWVHMGHMEGPGTKPFTLPVRPRRCDHWQWMLDGNGECHIYGLARVYEGGSDAVHGYDY